MKVKFSITVKSKAKIKVFYFLPSIAYHSIDLKDSKCKLIHFKFLVFWIYVKFIK
jgi:hypothetical protein